MLDSRRRRGTVMLQSYMKSPCIVSGDMTGATGMTFTSSALVSSTNKHLVFGHSYRAPATTSCITTHAYYLESTMDLVILTMYTYMTSVRFQVDYSFFYLTSGNEISETRVWSLLATEGPAPLARDSHVAVVHSNSMYIFGGSTGTAVNDFYELKLGKWSINWLEFQPIDPDDQL
ncbi:hypothetical protein PsorP6_014540 [Peronosclerospora sorghi]|uniref:Uncharacterized protein n=1 Tax=Peronosclerospora sorghi TaxID=230839 RepID=A0ACC0VTS1_9STRA|nr:hypothetical protein PsorP6_014540 [Peronosclerospora sorghi]